MKLLKTIISASNGEGSDTFVNGSTAITESHQYSRPGSCSEEFDRDAEIIGLKALISSKNERIATLRTVLKANKQTAEAGNTLFNSSRIQDLIVSVVFSTWLATTEV